MQVLQEYGYSKRGVVADWGCHVCRRIVYHRVAFDTLDPDERKGMCHDCTNATVEAERRAQHLWSLSQTEWPQIKEYRGGIYGLRDYLRDHLVGLVPKQRLGRLYRHLGLQLPRTLILLHAPEF